MKSFLLALSVFFAASAQGAGIFEIQSSKTAYAPGETVVLQASVATKPTNTDFEFDVVATLNADALPMDRVTDQEFFATTTDLPIGAYELEATLVIQDKRYARDLKESIVYLEGRITTVQGQIDEATDPEIIENLEAQKARYESMLAASEAELNEIRVVVQTETLQFSVE